jgi:uncharacterized membrane protein
MTHRSRLWEVDMLRGIAFVLMASYHLLFFINFLEIASLPIDHWAIWLLGRVSALLFIVLVGCSAQLRFWQLSERFSADLLTWQFLKRALTIFGCGLVITGITALYIPELAVIFGILHFIGVSTLFARFLVELSNRWLLGCTISLWLVGSLFEQLSTNTHWGLIFGIKPLGFSSLDYYPLFPWLGLVCLGIMVCRKLYAGSTRVAVLQLLLPRSIPTPLLPYTWIGRHSLALYMLHLPLFMAIFWILGILPS